MSELQHPAIAWAPAWADLQGRASAPAGPAVLIAADQDHGPEYVAAWPGEGAGDVAGVAASQPEARLTLVGSDAEGIKGFAGSLGLHCVQDRVALTASVSDLDQAPALPEEAQLAEAPLEMYDVVELSLFDHPVCRGRLRLRDEFAVVGITEAFDGAERELFERAIFAAMAEEAFLHGAENLTMLVESGQAAGYEKSGWKISDHVLSFERP